jgi:hypothetical protein
MWVHRCRNILFIIEIIKTVLKIIVEIRGGSMECMWSLQKMTPGLLTGSMSNFTENHGLLVDSLWTPY